MSRTGRHIAQRERASGRALLLPALLIVASGGAFGGLALVPTAPDAAAAATPPGMGSGGAADVEQRDAALAARGALRASRDRTPTAAPPAPAPAPPAPPVVERPTSARPGVGRLTSGFGPRWGRLHAGIDLAAGTGAPISAAADGVVLSAGDEGGYGRTVRVQHAEDTVTVYAHLSVVRVAAGQAVTAGTVLGEEGSTGHSTGPHLHFEVRVGGTPVDPLPWLHARGVRP